MTDDAAWFRDKIHAIFGDGAQSRFARFMALAGDNRPHSTIIRAINSYATGRVYPLPDKMRVIITLIENDLPLEAGAPWDDLPARVLRELADDAADQKAPLRQLSRLRPHSPFPPTGHIRRRDRRRRAAVRL